MGTCHNTEAAFTKIDYLAAPRSPFIIRQFSHNCTLYSGHASLFGTWCITSLFDQIADKIHIKYYVSKYCTRFYLIVLFGLISLSNLLDPKTVKSTDTIESYY